MMSLFGRWGEALRKHQHGADESVFDDERPHEQLRQAREQQRVHVSGKGRWLHILILRRNDILIPRSSDTVTSLL